MKKHISYSEMRLFATSPTIWRTRYVQKIWDDMTTPAMLVGSAFHEAVRTTLIGGDGLDVQLTIRQVLSIDDAMVRWTKQINQESKYKMFEQVMQALIWWDEAFIDRDGILEVEYASVEDVPFSELRIKAKADLIKRKEIIDWKLVSSFTDEEKPRYIIQAMFNYYAMRELFPDIQHMRFVEIKKTKSRDGIQVRDVVIPFDVVEYHEIFKFMVKTMEKAMNYTQMPNPFDMLGGDEEWEAVKALSRGLYERT